MNKDKPAFPVTGFETRHGQGMQAVYHSGMSLRDYFAAKVLQVSCEDHSFYEAAKIAYQYADAMLKAREE